MDPSIPGNPPPEVRLAPRGQYRTPQEMLAAFDETRQSSMRLIEQPQTLSSMATSTFYGFPLTRSGT